MKFDYYYRVGYRAYCKKCKKTIARSDWEHHLRGKPHNR